MKQRLCFESVILRLCALTDLSDPVGFIVPVNTINKNY